MCYYMGMPNKPNPENQMINFRLNRVLKKKLDKLARIIGVPSSTLITQWITDGTMNVELTPEEYEEIAREIRKARNK